MGAALKTLAIWLPLFLVAMALHESLHAAAVLVLGSQPELVVRPWAFALLPLSLPSVHVAAAPPLDLNRQALDNLAGPGLAALVVVAATFAARGRWLVAALAANAAGLIFYALIEPAYVLLDGRLDVEFLGTQEVNYGFPLALAVLAALWAGAAPADQQRGRRHHGGGQQEQRHPHSA
ncbi:MAG: hypothetical protein ABI838_03430 [Chloroflexota bacterium]